MPADRQRLILMSTEFVNGWQCYLQTTAQQYGKEVSEDDLVREEVVARKASHEFADRTMSRFVADLRSVLPIQYDRGAMLGRVRWLMTLTPGHSDAETAASITAFVDELLRPDQLFLYSFMLQGLSIEDVPAQFVWELDNGWKVRQLPIVTAASSHSQTSRESGPQLAFWLEVERRFAKNSEPGPTLFHLWVEAQKMLEALRLYRQEFVAIGEEAFSVDYPYSEIVHQAMHICFCQAKREPFDGRKGNHSGDLSAH